MKPTSAGRNVLGTKALRRLASRSGSASVCGTPRTASATATTVITTNASRQSISAVRPPTSGADVCPAACIDPNSPSARPSFSFGVEAAITASSTGVVNEFAAPCSAREASSTSNVHDEAASADVTA